MNNLERQAAIYALEQKLLDILDQYVHAIRKKESRDIKETIYAEVNRIEGEIRELKTVG